MFSKWSCFLFFSIKIVTFFSRLIFFMVGFGSIEEGKWLPTVIPALVHIFKPHDKFLASYWRKCIPSPPPPPSPKSQTSTFVCSSKSAAASLGALWGITLKAHLALTLASIKLGRNRHPLCHGSYEEL